MKDESQLFEKLNLKSDERLAHIVRSVSHGFRRALERRLAVHNIPFGHWVFLRILWEEDGLSQRELASRSNLSGPTVHTAITKMERLNLIHRKIPSGGKNRPVIHLTAFGAELREKLVPLAVEANQIATKGFKKDEIELLRSALYKMATNLATDDNR